MKKVPGRNGGTINRLEKGESGNLNGRPKKLPKLDDLLAEVMGEEKDGKTAMYMVLIKLRQDAIKGDKVAAKILIEHAYGKAKERIQLETDQVIKVVYDSE